MNSLTQINIFFKVDDEFEKEIIDISNKLSGKDDNKFLLNNKTRLPHVPLYLIALPRKNLGKAIREIKKLSSEIKPFELKIKNVGLSESGIVMIYFQPNEKILGYHRNVIKKINPLREEAQRKKYSDSAILKNLPNDQKNNYLKDFGQKYIFEYFEPHISLSHQSNAKETDQKISELNNIYIGRGINITNIRILEDDYQTSDAKKLILDIKL